MNILTSTKYDSLYITDINIFAIHSAIETDRIKTYTIYMNQFFDVRLKDNLAISFI